MKRAIVIGCAAAGMLAALGAAALAGLEVKPDKENVVASRLVGKWDLHASLNERLTGQGDGGRSAVQSYEFTADPAVARTIPDKYAEFFKGKQVYLAGKMKRIPRRGARPVRAYPFVLICHRGNPHVVYFRAKGDDPMGDAESFNVMLAPAKDKAKDLLFVGGDSNNQPFSAFQRATWEKE